MIGVMYVALSVEGTHPLAIEMLISLVMYDEMSFAQSKSSFLLHYPALIINQLPDDQWL